MVLVGTAHHRALVHSGVLAHHVFDHGGEHLEAVVPDDEPLDAAVQIHKAVLVQIAKIAGVHPDAAVRVGAQDHGRLIGLVVVALHHAGAADAQLAPLADGQLFLSARLKCGDQGVYHGDAHAAGLVHSSGGHGGGGGDLRHAVALGHGILHVVGLQELVDGLLCAQRDGVAARCVVADEGEVLLLQLGVGGNLLVVGRHAEHVLGPVLQEQAAQLGRVEVGDDDHLQAQHQRQMHAAGIAVGDEGGHNVHQGLALFEQGVVGRELLCNGVEAAVRQHHALGRAGGAAGVDDDAGMARVVGLGRRALALAVCEELLPVQHVGFVLVFIRGGQLIAQLQVDGQGVGRGEHQHPLHVGALGGLTAALVHHVQADEQVGVHFLDVIPDALHAVAGVHQVQRGTDEVGRIEGIDDLGGHDAHHRDDVALFDAEAPEGGGGLFHVHHQVGVGENTAIVIQGGLAQTVFILVADVVEGGHLRQLLLQVLRIVILQPGTRLRSVKNILFGIHWRNHSFCFYFPPAGGSHGYSPSRLL